MPETPSHPITAGKIVVKNDHFSQQFPSYGDYIIIIMCGCCSGGTCEQVISSSSEN